MRVPFPQVEGNEVDFQVRYPNGDIRVFWDASGAESAMRDYGAVPIDSNGNLLLDLNTTTQESVLP